jgi:hypothetical protein
VGVARQDRDRGKAAPDRLGHLGDERSGIADTGGAADTDDREAERFERLEQPGAAQQGGGRGRSGGERGLDPGLDRQPGTMRLLREQPRGDQ